MRITPSSSKLALLVILGVILSTVLIAIITTFIGSQITQTFGSPVLNTFRATLFNSIDLRGFATVIHQKELASTAQVLR